MVSSSRMMAGPIFSFISRRSSDRDLANLNEGQRISFDVEPDKKGKGPKAVNLVVS